MKAGYKVLAVSAVALGLAFFVFKKPSAGEMGEPAPSGSGGGLGGLISTGVKAIGKVVAKIFAPAAAATAVVGGGMAAAGGVATAGIGVVTLTGTNIALGGVAAAGTAAVPVTAGASGATAGLGAGIGTTAATVGGFATAAYILVSFFARLFAKNRPPFQAVMPATPYSTNYAEETVALEEVRVDRSKVLESLSALGNGGS